MMRKMLMGCLAAGALLVAGVAMAGECCDKAAAAGHVCFKCHPDQAKTCCAKAEAKGEKCNHPCCAKATAAGNLCEKCNPPKKEEPKT